MLAAAIDGMNESGALGGAGAGGVGRQRQRQRQVNGAERQASRRRRQPQRQQHGQPARPDRAVLGRRRPAADDAAPGPRPGGDRRRRRRGAAASASAASGRRWRSPSPRRARTRPRSARPRRLDGDEYVLNGEKIFVTSGDRAELIVVWATLDRKQGRAAIKSFVVERDNPGLKLDRLEHKLGIRASDTANFRLEDCRVPKENLLGSPEIEPKRGFAGVMQTFDNTRPLVAGHGDRRRAGVPGAHARAARGGRRSRSTTTRHRTRRAPRRRSSSRWSQTGRRRGC